MEQIKKKKGHNIKKTYGTHYENMEHNISRNHGTHQENIQQIYD